MGGTSNPPLGGGESRGVDDELIRLGVKGGGGLQAREIGAVAELGHGKAAVHSLEGQRALLQEGGKLLGGGLATEGAKEEAILRVKKEKEKENGKTENLRTPDNLARNRRKKKRKKKLT